MNFITLSLFYTTIQESACYPQLSTGLWKRGKAVENRFYFIKMFGYLLFSMETGTFQGLYKTMTSAQPVDNPLLSTWYMADPKFTAFSVQITQISFICSYIHQIPTEFFRQKQHFSGKCRFFLSYLENTRVIVLFRRFFMASEFDFLWITHPKTAVIHTLNMFVHSSRICVFHPFSRPVLPCFHWLLTGPQTGIVGCGKPRF